MSLLDLFKRTRSYGWHPDPADRRDVPLIELGLVRAEPTSASLRHPAVTVRDQDGTQSCVAFAWAQALELAYAHRGILTGDLSPLAIYFWARATHGAAGIDGGTYLRAAAKAVMRFGCASEKTHPFSSWRVNTSPPWKAYQDAFDRRGLRGYYSVSSSDFSGIRKAIASGRPIVGGWKVDHAFTQFRGDGVIDAIVYDTIGGHALTVVGYAADGTFELLNSWGTSFGNQGYCRVTEDFIFQGSDLWVLDVHP